MRFVQALQPTENLPTLLANARALCDHSNTWPKGITHNYRVMSMLRSRFMQ